MATQYKMFEAEAADGSKFTFMAPANSTEEQLQFYASNEYKEKKQKEQPKGAPTTSAASASEATSSPSLAASQAAASPSLAASASEAAKKAIAQGAEQTGMSAEGLTGGTIGGVLGALEQRGFPRPVTMAGNAIRAAATAAAPPTPSAAPASPLAAPTAPPEATPAGGLTAARPGPAGSVIADAGYLGAGETGRQVYNYAKSLGFTDIEAANMVKQGMTAKDVFAAAQQVRSAGMQKVQQLFPGQAFQENPAFGGLLTEAPSAGGGPRAQYVQAPEIPPSPEVPGGRPAGLQQLPPKQPIPTVPKPPSGLDQVTQLFKNMAQTGSTASRAVGAAAKALPIVSYPLAGYSMGEDIGAIREQLAQKRPDYADIALRGAGALGTGLSLHPATAPVGLPLAIGAPLVAAARRKFMAEPKQPDLTYEEMVQASKPSFRYSRP